MQGRPAAATPPQQSTVAARQGDALLLSSCRRWHAGMLLLPLPLLV
jgi:hypothetical protein